MENNLRLDGKVAVITGGSSGIGLAAAKRFVAEGAYVYIIGRRQEQLAAATAEIGSNVTAIQGDISSLEDLDHIYSVVKSAHGRVDIVFANAGFGAQEPIGNISEEKYDAVFNANVKGTLFTVQKALPLMSEGGSIILTGSTTASMGAKAYSVYSASKAAIRSFARCWAMDLKGTGIRVNVLSPGPTATPGIINAFTRTGMLEQIKSQIIEKIPLGRMGNPEEAGAAALFLASGESSFMTGSELFVDGGMAQV